MKKTNKFRMLNFRLVLLVFTLVLLSSMFVGAEMPCPYTSLDNNNLPHSSTTEKWRPALQSQSLNGWSWIGKINSNGPNDDFYRADKGRDTIIFAPCTTDFSKPVEMLYFFHGNEGFDKDMKERLVPQSKQMSQQGRNFVLVFPELPWSAGTDSTVRGWAKGSKNPNGRYPHAMVWKGDDSNLVQLHQEVIGLILKEFPNLNVGAVSLTGHSGGGSALRKASEYPSKNNNAMMQLKVNKITFSDADYGWAGDGTSATQAVYENYVKNNPSVELNMLVQDFSASNPHDPTKLSITFVKAIGGPTVSSWSWENKVTPGTVVDQPFKVPGHSNINYVPLSLDHKAIGTMSLAWASSGSNAPGQIQKGVASAKSSSGQTYGSEYEKVPRNLPKRQKEIDEVWYLRIGEIVRGNPEVWDTNTKTWQRFDDVYYDFILKKTKSPSTATPQQPSTPQQPVPPQHFGTGVPAKMFSSEEWRLYQEKVGATEDNPGIAGGEKFGVFAAKQVTVDAPNFNGQQPSKQWTISLNPSLSCPSDICLNDITPKARNVKAKTGVMIHATVGNDYLGLTKGWSQGYWNPDKYIKCHKDSVDEWNQKFASQCGGEWPYSSPEGVEPLSDAQQDKKAECAKKINPKVDNNGYRKSIKNCRKAWGHTQYIFGRDGNYAQHASEYSNIWHSRSGKEDLPKIPLEQLDLNTIAIEVANAMYNCEGICHSDSRTYKGKTATECGQNACILPSQMWGGSDNYLPKSDLTHGNVKKKVDGSKTYEKFADAQMKGLVKLVAEIMIRHNMHIDNLIRHTDNTWRGCGSSHTDPGPMFDWMGFKKSVCQAVNQYQGSQIYDCNNLKVCGGC